MMKHTRPGIADYQECVLISLNKMSPEVFAQGTDWQYQERLLKLLPGSKVLLKYLVRVTKTFFSHRLGFSRPTIDSFIEENSACTVSPKHFVMAMCKIQCNIDMQNKMSYQKTSSLMEIIYMGSSVLDLWWIVGSWVLILDPEQTPDLSLCTYI